ncbi:glycosyltransferase family 2 protein [Candidatus Microgenomates bacterium]|nr:glycosyltransferase family 2 protein [Candidatus Microgenomates bacterium]
MKKKQYYNLLVSIVIPAYNEEKYIEKCIQSILKQTWKNFEILVINDGSNDRTAIKVQNFKNTNIHLFHQKHYGTGVARNYGTRMSNGKVIVFIDADMYVDKNFLENLIIPIFKKKCIGTYTTAEYVANSDNIWSKCWNINSDLPTNKRISNNVNYSQKVFRAILKSKFIKTAGFNPKLGYMDDKSLEKYGFKLVAVNNAKCFHYNPESLKDVFYSARWIGRSSEFNLSVRNIFRYSFINSILISIKKIFNRAPIKFFIFKILFDFGILTGIFFKNQNNNYAK